MAPRPNVVRVVKTSKGWWVVTGPWGACLAGPYPLKRSAAYIATRLNEILEREPWDGRY